MNGNQSGGAGDPGGDARALLAHLRHELGTPLNAIIGYSEMLLETESAGLVDFRPELQRIHAAGLQVLALLGRRIGAGAAAAPESAELPEPAGSGVEEAENTAPIPPTPADPLLPTERASLLVVDDNEANRDVLSRFLARQGHDITPAASGHEALALMADRRVDLVLLDILMPGMNGFELLQRMKSSDSLRRIPVIFISALDDAQGKLQAFRAGGVDYVTKPFQAEEVVARVENQLKISRLQDNLARQNEELARKNDELVRAQKRTDLVFSALADALPGTILDGKYRLDDKIGSGGFGAVFRGTHLGLDLPVAIKVFRPIAGNDTPEALERFRQEGVAASRIKHPNAIEIFDNGISSTGIAYLVMELVHGHTLETELAAGGALTPARTAEILVPVCEALAEVHAAGVVHRDITPENIYLHQGRQGEVVKLLDFGLSKMLGTTTDETRLAVTMSGCVGGTPAYMAPERLLNTPCDGRSDVYSLGVILYRMLCGRPPFDAGTGGVYALMMMHLSSDPPSLRDNNPSVPPALDAVVRSALSKEPQQRPTASQLAQLIRASVAV